MHQPTLEWRDVVGFEGKYEVSENGLVRKPKTKRAIKTSYIHPSGYKFLVLTKDRKRSTTAIHRLVAKAFIPNPNNLPQVNHKDTDKTNNHFSNLEWCTNAENQAHAIKNGLVRYVKGSEHGNSIIDEHIAASIRVEYMTGKYSWRTLGQKYGISKAHVGQILRRITWKHVN